MKEKLFKVWDHYLNHPELVSEYWSSGARDTYAFRIFPVGWDKEYGVFIQMSNGNTFKVGYKKFEIEISREDFTHLKEVWDEYKSRRDDIERVEYNKVIEHDRREMEGLADSIA